MRRLVNSSDVVFLLYSVIPLQWVCGLARWYGRLTYLVRRGDRATVRRNLDRIFGETMTERERKISTRQFFEYKRVRGVLLGVLPRLTASKIEGLLPVEGMEHLDEALRRERGVILLGSHINSVCLFLTVAMFRERGYDVRVAVPEPGDPWPSTAVRRFLNRRFGTLALSESIAAFYAQFNIRPIVRSLAENAIVAQTGDGLHSARFVEVDFLGRRVPFPTGMESVAQVTGAVVVPIFQVGAPTGTMRVVIEEPWTVDRGGDREEALRDAVARYAERLEHHLLENIPCWEHWLIEDTLGTMSTWQQKPLEERYGV